MRQEQAYIPPSGSVEAPLAPGKPILPPQPTGVVPFIDASVFASYQGGKIPPDIQMRFSTTSEANEVLAFYNSAIAADPRISASFSIEDASAADGITLNIPWDPTNPDSVGDLVIAGTITVNFQPPFPGLPTPDPISGPLSDYVGNLYKRRWQPGPEQYDKNYGNTFKDVVPGKINFMYLINGSLFEAFWIPA